MKNLLRAWGRDFALNPIKSTAQLTSLGVCGLATYMGDQGSAQHWLIIALIFGLQERIK